MKRRWLIVLGIGWVLLWYLLGGLFMSIVTFLLLLVIAAIAAGVWALIVGWSSRGFAAAFTAFALLLVLPTLLPGLLGG